MTEKEYTNKLQELRIERNKHQVEANRIQKEMDDLESDRQLVDLVVNQHIVLDRTSANGYRYYFYVQGWHKTNRGVTMQGFGFYSTSYSAVQFQYSMSIGWDEVNSIKTISKEDFFNAYDEYMKKCNESFIQYYTATVNGNKCKVENTMYKLPENE